MEVENRMYNRNNPLLYPVKPPLPVIEGIRACPPATNKGKGSLIPHLPDVGGKGVRTSSKLGHGRLSETI